MLKESVLLFFALVAVSLAYPAEDAVQVQPNAVIGDRSVNIEPLEEESLEGAESANPHGGWGRGWGGGYGGGLGRGWGGGYGGGWGHRGWGGGLGRGWGGGWHNRGWGWGK